MAKEKVASRSGTEPQVPSFKFNLGKFPIIFIVVLLVSLLLTRKPRFHPLNYYLTVVWSSFLPLAIAGLVGAWMSRKIQPSEFQGIVENKVIFTVPTVATNDTNPALRRVVDSILKYAPNNLVNFRIDIIVDEGAEGEESLREAYGRNPKVEIVVVPESYQTQNGATNKARANHYALELRSQRGESTRDTFVYHLDDDTAVGSDTISSLAEFVARDNGNYHLAQGVLTFPFALSPSWFCRLADSIRPADDLTKFYFFTGVMGRPLAGLHGEHLLIRANVEAKIGWDFGPTKVEDAYFGLRFVERYPGGSTFLNSCTYGASPASIQDLVKQRRRWAGGLLGLAFGKSVALRAKLYLMYGVINWTMGLLQHVGVVLAVAYLVGIRNTSPISWGFVPIWSFNLAWQIQLYLEGLKLNMETSNLKGRYLIYSLLILPLIFVFSAVEAFAAMLGLLSFLRGDDEFEVISKQK